MATQENKEPSQRRVSIYPLLTINFVGTLGFSVVLPFLVFLVTRWGGNALIYGIMGATYSAFQLVGAPILGRWSDVFGRRRILLLSQIGTLLSWVLFLIAMYLPVTPIYAAVGGPLGTFTLSLPLLVLFLARALDGATGGNVSVANAYLADVTEEQDRTAAFGKMAVSGNLGFVVGPALAGFLGGTNWGEVAPITAALAISVVATVIIAFALPESRPCIVDTSPDGSHRLFGQEQKDCYEARKDENPTVRMILSLPHVGFTLSLQFLVWLAFNFFYISFPVHAVRVLEWTVRDTGIFFSVMAGLMVLVQGPILGWASRRWSSGGLVSFGSMVLVPGFALFTQSGLVAIYAAAILLALGNGLMWPSLTAYLSTRAGDEYQGAVQGFAGSAAAVASILGLVVGGLLYDRLGGTLTFSTAAVIIFIVCLFSFRCRVQIPKEPSVASTSE